MIFTWFIQLDFSWLICILQMVRGELSFPRIERLAEWPFKANFTIEKYSMNSSRDSESMANKCGTSAANRNWCLLRDGVGLK